SCPNVDPTKLNVHLVAHTHDDVGWLKTLDQYYYGSRNDIQNAGVQYIIDSVVDSLVANPDRRFIYVETAFFWKWWVEQDEDMQQTVKDLVNEGRLEFIGGAWSMNDEAASHYYSTIDQFTWGLRKLNDTFGACGRPHIGWQIDPFGHSREMASLFAQMGYDGVLFARLDYQDKDNRLKTKTPEMIWEGSPNLGESADLFTSVLYNFYNAPGGFCFDILCNDQPFIDNVESPDYNVDQKVQDFVNFVKTQGSYYTSSNIILTMGGDFNYQDANTWFKNLDKLIKYVNAADSTLNVIYSTPSCYLKAVNDAGLTYTTKQDDFFPYASDPHSYWTGYFTSRPASKYFERLGNNFLQVAKQLEAMTLLGQVGDSSIDDLREAMGVMQHHDAITGTEKQHVAGDYARLQYRAMDEASVSVETALNQLMENPTTTPIEIHSCLLFNISECHVTERGGSQFLVTVYNPLSHSLDYSVRFPVPSGTYTVQDPTGAELPFQIIPLPDEVLALPERDSSIATHELAFRALSLPPLGFRSYYVVRVSDDFVEVEPSADTFIGDSLLQVTIDNVTGLVDSLTINGEEIALSQNFFYYDGYIGENDNADHRSSGAYIFRPISSVPQTIATSATWKIYKGHIVDEIHQTFSPWVSQVIRIYKQENHVEFSWLVGPIPIEDTTKGQEFAVLNDRAQGGSSLNDGEVELMLQAQHMSTNNNLIVGLQVHRRLLHDDAFGVGEALNEVAYDQGLVVRGRHYVIAGPTSGLSPSLAAQERELEQKKMLSPWMFFAVAGPSFEYWQSTFKMEFSGLTESLPQNVKIHTLEPWRDQTLLLRLEHILEQDDDPELSQPATVVYEDIFSTFTVTSSHETTLAANQWIEDLDRLVWKSDSAREPKEKQKMEKDPKYVTLTPMQIKTYVIDVAKR
ncbi:hypothetical protein ANN_15455, partial [Periplaneta americana]